MMQRLLIFVLLAMTMVGAKCGGGDGSGGSASRREFDAPNPLCSALFSPFPPGFAFVPGNPNVAWVTDFSPPTLVAFHVDVSPPQIISFPGPFVLPFDSDGDGRDEGSAVLPLAPVFDDIAMEAPDLALVTASGYEEVIFFSPASGALRQFEVSVPAGFQLSDNPLLPAPGTAALRTALSTFACVRPPSGALDSRGASIASALPAAAFCDVSTPSYLASFTSGAAISAGRLFVSTSNLGGGAGTANTQYLPGSVLIYDIDTNTIPPSVAPHPSVPVLITESFNPTHVTAYASGGRDFVLVTASGAIGIAQDDPATPEIEGGALALTGSSIDVIDAQSLEVVATIPLGVAALAGGPLAIDPRGRVAVVGSAAGREVYAVDLAPLASLPSSVLAPITLDGSMGVNAVLFDVSDPLSIPALASGAPAASCPGSTSGVAFNDAGDLLYVSEFCDGTLTWIDVDLSGAPAVPVPANRFVVLGTTPIASPLRVDTLGQARAPGRIAVRPGRPGIDFVGRDLFYLIGQPEGSLCAIGIESS